MAVAVAVGFAAAACGGGETPEPEPSAPAEHVDPTSDNVITGPINRAKQTADDAEERYQELEADR